MFATRRITFVTFLASLLLFTACGKKNQVAQKRAVPPTTANGVAPVAPQPSSGSQSLYAPLQGTWTESCEYDTNEIWSVKISGDTLTYSGADCDAGTAVPGGFSLKFKLSSSVTSGDFSSHITYYNTDGSVYFDEDITGTSNPRTLYFSGDDTVYSYTGN